MRCGYTIIELMVTILIVAALATAVGTFAVKLLTIQECDREEAYVREKLADICANYADFASIGSTFSVSTSGRENIVAYRLETGGLSLETGRVSRVAYFTTATTNQTMDVNVYSLQQGKRSKIFYTEKEGLASKWARILSGDASLLTLRTGQLNPLEVICTIKPLGIVAADRGFVPDENFAGFNIYSNAAFANLEVAAWYTYKNSRGEMVLTNAVVERLVRLWNHR